MACAEQARFPLDETRSVKDRLPSRGVPPSRFKVGDEAAWSLDAELALDDEPGGASFTGQLASCVEVADRTKPSVHVLGAQAVEQSCVLLIATASTMPASTRTRRASAQARWRSPGSRRWYSGPSISTASWVASESGRAPAWPSDTWKSGPALDRVAACSRCDEVGSIR